MSAYYNHYLSRNEVSFSLDTSVPVIEMESSTSIVRPLAEGANWNALIFSFKNALIGGPSTGNIRGFLAFGVCSGNRRFSMSSTTAGEINSHALGFGGSSLADYTLTGYTDARTNPTNQNVGWFGACRPFLQVSNSFSTLGALGGGHAITRYETEYNPSIPVRPEWFGKSIVPLNFSIIRGSPNYTYQNACMNINDATDRITASINIPYNVMRQSYDIRGPYIQNFNNNNLYCQPLLDSFGLSGANLIMSINTISNGTVPNESVNGLLDSFFFFYKMNTPGAKLIIKDLMIYRLT